MKQTIEEVKKVAIECGLNDEYWYDYSEELQAFAQHFMDKQRESDAALFESDPSMKNFIFIAKAIRNNTGE